MTTHNNKKRQMSSYQYVKIARFAVLKKKNFHKKINHGGTKNKNKKKMKRKSVESAAGTGQRTRIHKMLI